MLRGIVFPLHIKRRHHDERRTTGVTRGFVSVAGVRGLTSGGPSTLSNKRRRHITVTHTLIRAPQILLLSRPLDGLSTHLQLRVHRRVHHLIGKANVAAVFIARSRRRTLSVSSHVILVGRNIIRRCSGPRGLCLSPTGLFITRFVNDPVVGVFSVEFSHSSNVLQKGTFSVTLTSLSNSQFHTNTTKKILTRRHCGINVHPRCFLARPIGKRTSKFGPTFRTRVRSLRVVNHCTILRFSTNKRRTHDIISTHAKVHRKRQITFTVKCSSVCLFSRSKAEIC